MSLAAYGTYERYKESGGINVSPIPIHWDSEKARFLLLFSKGLTITKENLQDEGIPCVNYGEIHSKFGFAVDPKKHALKCVSPDYLKTNLGSLLKQGDFVFADTSEDIEGSGNFTHLESSVPTFAGYHTVIARCHGATLTRYLAYMFDSTFYREQIQKMVKGVKVYSISQGLLKNTEILLPPLPEQRAIASFLDDKCEKIDEAMRIKEAQIALLRERRQILIQEAVTRGLNPDAPMKDSGIDWIGQIPAHWSRSKVSHFATVGNGSTPSRSNMSYWEGGNIPWLNSSKVNDVEITKADQFVTARAKRECHLPNVEQGDIVMGITGQGKTRGMVALCKIATTINQHLAYIRIGSPKISSGFLLHFFDASYEWMRQQSESNGSTKGAITCDDIKNYFVVVPPAQEQREVVRHIQNGNEKIQTAISIKQDQITALKEYKTSLINAAVTGKIKVI